MHHTSEQCHHAECRGAHQHAGGPIQQFNDFLGVELRLTREPQNFSLWISKLEPF